MTHDRPNAPTPAANDEASALAALKSLLVGPEQHTIQRLDQELHDRQVQTERVSENLPGALERAYRETPAELTDALDLPVAGCLRDSVRRDPGFFADVLYPVMGPAIRRSITQAMKGLVQQINQTLEHSLTLKGLRWRLEAARSGVPFAEIVLRNTLRYRVEEVFLIQSGNGLLIQHLTQANANAHDPDAVSGMLTAIRDFAGDTFDDGAGETTRLETVDTGEHTLWLVHGPQAYLACAIRGVPPVTLRDELARVVELIHQRHGDVLTGFANNPGLADRLRPILEPCLKTETATPDRRRFPWPFAIIAVLIIGGLTWWAHGLWQERSGDAAQRARLEDAVDRLNATPGTVVTDWQIDQGQLLLTGLHDPLTRMPSEVLREAGLSLTDYRAVFQSFESALPGAALARAQQRLAPPETVSLTLKEDGTLSARGVSSDAWIERAALLAVTIPGITAYNASGLERRDDRLHRDLAERLVPPETVDLQVGNGIGRLSGAAPLDWIETLPDEVSLPDGQLRLDANALEPSEALRLAELRTQVEQAWILFGGNGRLDATQQARVATLADMIAELQQHASRLGRSVRLHVIGRTDHIGTPEQNLFVARDRAVAVAQGLQETGLKLPDIVLNVVALPPQPPGLTPEHQLRRVEFRVREVPVGIEKRSIDR